MKAVILAGGEATRLRPLSCNIPKIMVPVLNRPFFEHLIGYLKKQKIIDIILAIGKPPDQIQSYFGDGSDFGVKIAYSVETFPMGTAGAVKNAERFLGAPFLVFNGDIFTNIDLRSMIGLHGQRKASVSIALTPVDDPTAYGVVETDADGRVKRFLEKPKRDEVITNMINAGIYILAPDILSYIPPDAFSMFERDVFPLVLERREAIYAYSFEAFWTDVGTPEKYLKLHHDLLAGEGIRFEGESFVHPSAEIKGSVIIGQGCSVDKNCIVIGPAVLGSGCQIEEAALVEGAVLWQNCKVGKGTKLRNCILASNCYVEEGSEVWDNCVLGDNVRIGKGNKLPQGVRIWPDKSIEPNAISF